MTTINEYITNSNKILSKLEQKAKVQLYILNHKIKINQN